MEITYPRRLLAALLLLAPASPALATDCNGPAEDCVPVGGWNFSVSLGAGVRTNPVVHESDIPLVVIPQVSYYGKHFFLDNLDGGVTLVDTDSVTLSLIASPGYDRVFFYRTDPQNIFVKGLGSFNSSTGSGGTGPPLGPSGGGQSGNPNPGSGGGQNTDVGGGTTTTKVFPPRPRAITYLAGPEWTFKYQGLVGQLDLLHEITGHNHGDEIRAALGFPLSHAGGTWTANIGLTWKSSAIVNYYYGAPGIYQGGPALDPFLKLAYTRPLKGNWKFTGFVEGERLGKAIADSPIVNQRIVTTTFVGLVYVF
jgi:outer membrane protein